MTIQEKEQKNNDLITRIRNASSYIEFLELHLEYAKLNKDVSDQLKIVCLSTLQWDKCLSDKCIRNHVDSDLSVFVDNKFYHEIGGLNHWLTALLEMNKQRVIMKENHVLTTFHMEPQVIEEDNLEENTSDSSEKKVRLN